MLQSPLPLEEDRALDTATGLGEIALFAGLQARARARLASASWPSTLAAGDTSNALEQGGAVLFVVEGQVRSSALAGGLVAFEDYRAGDVFGLDLAMAGDDVPPRALLALAASRALVVPVPAVLAAIRASAAVAFAVARHFATRLVAAGSLEPGPLQLVFRDLLRSARPTGDSRWTLDPMPRHRELAARAGVTEDAAAAAIAHLVRLGVARRRYPALDIEDRDALRRLAG